MEPYIFVRSDITYLSELIPSFVLFRSAKKYGGD